MRLFRLVLLEILMGIAEKTPKCTAIQILSAITCVCPGLRGFEHGHGR